MKVKRIVIELELEEKDEQDQATIYEMVDSRWKVNGIFYPRFGEMMTTVWHLVRDRVKN